MADLQENEIGPNLKWIKVVDNFEAAYELFVSFPSFTPSSTYRFFHSITNNGTTLYFRTNSNAAHYKVASIDVADLKSGFRDFIPEDPNAHLEDIHAVNDKYFVAVYKRNVRHPLSSILSELEFSK